MPYFVELSNSMRESAHFISIDVDDHDDVAQKYNIFSIPLFIAFKDGQEIRRYAGSSHEKLLEFVNKK